VSAASIRPVDVACQAFWSLRHPLNLAYRRAHAVEVDGAIQPAWCFSLRQLISYAEELPPEVLHDYADGGAVPVEEAA
jgi:hypothetical protein